ncbi:MAG: response regulator transcription factor [Candidatus Marinimicrobia bacterium]|jgi:DNA-binding NarL/FixJ family response regulator|nr:response regulator transcription factor [Candidatus Neomarinimicrobiota bacterium]MBT3501038.1 response regulator transcription factor [Candidatus Neomarinimicrobiota bacterium]MBT3838818.1 response regulator transcription factor [Candidatus Neomarinimicrobiota bacterium]MBT3998795.1 response regulator transcription factor [Candidatus Neomarinimicrobiota bacterium]MBT4579302.1 response regulator transcription factor [Candidatus Neomarinimicrobiota bacterium]
MTKKTIKVFIADDHGVVRSGLKMILESQDDIHVISEAENGMDAIKLILDLKPDVALLDISMPKINGLDVAKKVLKQLDNIKIILLSMYSDEAYVLSAIKSGVHGYLLKQSDTNTLIDAVRDVHAGKTFFSPSIADIVLKAARDKLNGGNQNESKLESLSPREKQVLIHLANGNSSKNISEQLFISERTVNKHRQNIMDKLEIHDAVNLTRYALEKGLVKKGVKEPNNKDFHFIIESQVYIKSDAVGRKFTNMNGADAFEKYLGYTQDDIKQIFDLNIKYKSISKHPYLKILGKDEKNSILKSEQAMIQLYDQLSDMTIENSNLTKNKIFIHKNGHKVETITHDNFNWANYKTIQKIRFLDPDDPEHSNQTK